LSINTREDEGKKMLKLERIGIVGAGTMGGGIAQKIAQEGCGVVLSDVSYDLLNQSMDNIKRTLGEGVKRNILSEEEARSVHSRIQITPDLSAMAECQLVIEAVFEDLAVKKEVFKKLDRLCPSETVFATNTSTLSVNELAVETQRPDQFIGLHFFYHPAMNRLLEIIFLKNTLPQAKAISHSVSNLMGKTPIFVTDSPGFAVNRFFIPWSMEAIRILDEGLGDIPSIDHVVKHTFNVGMGPFEFMNVVHGFSLAYLTSTTLAQRISRFYGPPAGLEYKFKKGGTWDLSGDPRPESFQRIEDRLLGAVFFVAASLVDEGVASMVDTDIGAKVGLRWKTGPFELMNQVGIERSYSLAKSIVERNPDLKMPVNLEIQNQKEKPWDIQYVTLVKEGPIAHITIKRPEVLNALNETVFSQLGQCLDEIEKDPAIDTVVIGGSGKDFVAGADIEFFINLIKAERFKDLTAYGAHAQEIVTRIEESEKFMIARVQGLALGGGLELALACDTIVASDKAAFGFPETSIGIYPGLGGMPRSIRKVGKALAKYLVLTGQIIDPATALKMGLIEYVFPVTELDEKIGQISSDPSMRRKEPRSKFQLDENLKLIQEQFSDGNIEKVLWGKGIEENELTVRLHRKISSKAPLAIKLANKVIDEGETLPLKEALELERRYAGELFKTEDALEGLQSVAGKYRPTFKGK
jgi:enoyl-CoA hydratase/3-hydroxyacyl-CoA dehydrogenase